MFKLMHEKADIDGILDLPDDYSYDDVLTPSMLALYAAHQTTLSEKLIIEDLLEFFRLIEDYPTTTTNNLSPVDIQSVK